jgi:hypothetical protein
MDAMTPLWIASAAAASFFFAKSNARENNGIHLGWLSLGIVLSAVAILSMISTVQTYS